MVFTSNYTNLNGLVDGNIPAGQPCPFIGQCTMKNERCPTEGNVKPCAYSCALARLHSVLAEGKKRGESLPILEHVRDNLKQGGE
jgi:hypothetical protein